ncbi:MAG: Ig domain-containing protein [Chlorobiaceae bacterium]
MPIFPHQPSRLSKPRKLRLALTAFAAALLLLPTQGPAIELSAGEHPSQGEMSDLSRSIIADAKGTGAPSSAATTEFANIAGGIIGSLRRAAGSSGNQYSLALPGRADAESRVPSIPLLLADGKINAAFNPAGTTLQYNGDNTIATASLGFGYLKKPNELAATGQELKAATMIGSQIAAGTDFSIYQSHKDLVVNTLLQVPDSGFRFRLSGGYLWGAQNFDFPSGTANIDLEQFSYLFSTQYILPKSRSISFLQSIGLSAWGARANQLSNADGPRLFLQDSGTEYLIMNDPLALSEGHLFGASGDMQIALRSNMVVKGSVGYEQLRFPFADGTSELNRKTFYNVDLNYEPFPSLAIGGGYKAGASEKRTTLVAGIRNWSLSAFINKGQNGVSDNRGVMLTYTLAIPGRNRQTDLASRLQPNRGSDKSTMLADALIRPVQIPQTFLAKVDLTAVTQVGTATRSSAMTLQVAEPVTSFTPLAATGGTAPFTYFVSAGTLPAGLALNATTGAVTGIPTTAQSAASVTFAARDADSVTFGQTITLIFTVNAAAPFDVGVIGL